MKNVKVEIVVHTTGNSTIYYLTAYKATKCLTCAEGLYLYDQECQVCPNGFSGNDDTGECDEEGIGSTLRTTLIYFPFLIIAFILVLVSIGG